jgi:hypothetical protein
MLPLEECRIVISSITHRRLVSMFLLEECRIVISSITHRRLVSMLLLEECRIVISSITHRRLVVAGPWLQTMYLKETSADSLE